MAISFVQAASNTAGSTNTLSKAFTSNNTAGNCLIVIGNANYSNVTYTISDTLGNTYAGAPGSPELYSGSQSSYIWYAANCTAGANTVTIVPSSGGVNIGLVILEYSGLALTSPVDAYANNSGNGTSMTTGNTGTTTQAVELAILSLNSQNGNIVNPSGWTSRARPYSYLQVSDNITSTTGVQSASTTDSSGSWTAQIVTFKQPSATGNFLMLM
jgi:hypothetical protein